MFCISMFYIPHHQNIFVSSHPCKGLHVKHKKPFASLKYLYFLIFWCCLFARKQKTNFLSPRGPGRFDICGGLSGLTFVFTQSHFSGTWAIKIPTLSWLLKPIMICAGIYELSIRPDVLNEEMICSAPSWDLLRAVVTRRQLLVWPCQGNQNFAGEPEPTSVCRGSPKCGFSAALGPADAEIISCLSIHW